MSGGRKRQREERGVGKRKGEERGKISTYQENERNMKMECE